LTLVLFLVRFPFLMQSDRESGGRPQPQVGVQGAPGARDQPHLLLDQPGRLCKQAL